MGELYEWFLSDGVPPNPRQLQTGHWFESLMGQYGAGIITGQETIAAWTTITGEAPSATVQQEVLDIIATVPVTPAMPTKPTKPTKPSTVNATNAMNYADAVNTYAAAVNTYAEDAAARVEVVARVSHRIRQIMEVFHLARAGVTGYATPADMRAKLGVPAR